MPQNEQAHLFCALLDPGPNGYTGQIAGNRSGYFPSMNSTFTVEGGPGLTTFLSEDGGSEFIGKMQPVRLGTTDHLIAVMIPAEDYRALVKAAQLKIAAILLIMALSMLLAALWGSKKYVAPILRDLKRIKGGTGPEPEVSRVLEIGDLFAFLEQQNREHEAALAALHQEKQEASGRLNHLQSELRQVSSDYQSAQKEISRLAYSRTREVDPDNFAFFLGGIQNSLPPRRRSLTCIWPAKAPKRLLRPLASPKTPSSSTTKTSTISWGVSSRKQMLRYAALMKQQEKDGT